MLSAVKLQLGAFPVARYRGTLAIAVAACFADWAVKAAHPFLWGGWVPHETGRSLLNLLWALPLLTALLWLLPTRLAVVGCGLMLGGMSANLFDVVPDGVVWNMFPLPGSDMWFNTADAWIVLGGLLLTASVLNECWKLRPVRTVAR